MLRRPRQPRPLKFPKLKQNRQSPFPNSKPPNLLLNRWFQFHVQVRDRHFVQFVQVERNGVALDPAPGTDDLAAATDGVDAEKTSEESLGERLRGLW